MTTETKRLIITIINIAIFACNAIISFISGSEIQTAVGIVTGFLAGVSLG
jgi:hypothetical protein